MAIAKRMRGLNKSERQELIEALLHHPEYLPARLALARHYVSVRRRASVSDSFWLCTARSTSSNKTVF